MECPHGMPSVGSCIECMYEGLLEPPKKLDWVRSFTATRDGQCGNNSNHEIIEGDTIYLTDNGWVCERCVTTPKEVEIDD